WLAVRTRTPVLHAYPSRPIGHLSTRRWCLRWLTPAPETTTASLGRVGAGEQRLKRGQAIHAGGIAQTVVRENRAELSALVVQCHVVQQQRLDQQVDVVGGWRRRCFHVGAGAHPADLLVTCFFFRGRAEQYRATARIVDQRKGGSGR